MQVTCLQRKLVLVTPAAHSHRNETPPDRRAAHGTHERSAIDKRAAARALGVGRGLGFCGVRRGGCTSEGLAWQFSSFLWL